MKIDFKKIKNNLMTGISYMIPLTVIGGICYAGAIALGGTAVEGQGMVVTNEILLHLQEIGSAGLFLMIPILCGYIAYAVAGKPALAPGFVVGYLCNTEITIGGNAVKTGFIGAFILGFIMGYLVKAMKKIKWPKMVLPVVPILVIPVVTSILVGLCYIYIFANPIGIGMNALNSFLFSLSSSSKIVVGIIIGAMVTFDMGGPINKTACTFSIAMMAEGHYEFFGICAVGICTAPLGLGLATLLAPNKYTKAEKDAGKASLFMGLIGISEGAIPLAVADPKNCIPANMVGGAIGGIIAAYAGVLDFAPHGGPIVLPIIEGKIAYIIAIIVGTLVTALVANLLKKPLDDAEIDIEKQKVATELK